MAIQKPKIYKTKPHQFVDDYTTYNEAARDTKRNVTLNKPKMALERAAHPSPSKIIVATKKTPSKGSTAKAAAAKTQKRKAATVAAKAKSAAKGRRKDSPTVAYQKALYDATKAVKSWAKK